MSNKYNLPDIIKIKIYLNESKKNKDTSTVPKLDGILEEAFSEGVDVVKVWPYSAIFGDLNNVLDKDFVNYKKTEDKIAVYPLTTETRSPFTIRKIVYEKENK